MISTGSTYREKLETDARARIFWGDAQAEVVKYLVENGMDQKEVDGMVEAFVHERADTIRKMGFKKILIGTACVAAPMVPWIVLSAMLHRFFMPPIMFACVPGSIGVYGLYSLFKGTMMYVMPDSETGDVAEAD